MTDNASNPTGGPNASNPDHPRQCVARRRDGERCTRWAVKGATVCPTHGGSIGRVRAAAARRRDRSAAEQAAATLGLPVDVDPGQALVEELHRAAGAVAWLAAQVATLDPEEVVWGTVVDRDGEHGYTERRAAPNVWVVLLAEWVDRKARIAKAALDAGVQERHIRIEEAKGEAIGRLIAAVLDDPELALSVDQQALARQVAARHLRALPTPLA